MGGVLGRFNLMMSLGGWSKEEAVWPTEEGVSVEEEGWFSEEEARSGEGEDEEW